MGIPSLMGYVRPHAVHCKADSSSASLSGLRHEGTGQASASRICLSIIFSILDHIFRVAATRPPGCTFAFFVVKIIISMTTMAATILDGNKIAAQIKAELAEDAQKLSAACVNPGLAVFLARHNPDSEIYVRNKVKTC